jgi:hypothetical protein
VFDLIISFFVELYDALDCYKIAMQDPVSQRNPVHYFEIAAILLRLGRHQVRGIGNIYYEKSNV